MITKHTGSTKNKKYTKHTYDTKATCIPRLPTLHRITSIPRIAIPSDCRIISSTISFPTLAWARRYLLLATISPNAQTSSFASHFLPLTSHLSPLSLNSQRAESCHRPVTLYQQWFTNSGAHKKVQKRSRARGVRVAQAFGRVRTRVANIFAPYHQFIHE